MPRRPVEWMTRADDYILGFLAETDAWANPATIAYNLDYANSYMSERCMVLSDNGLLKRSPEKSMYRITELGQRYVDGDLDRSELDRQQD